MYVIVHDGALTRDECFLAIKHFLAHHPKPARRSEIEIPSATGAAAPPAR